MEVKEDERLDPIRSFTLISFKLDPDTWRQFVSEEETMETFNSFCGAQERRLLFLHRQPDTGCLSFSLSFPAELQSKIICISKRGRKAVTKDNARKLLIIQYIQAGDSPSPIITVTGEVTCLLVSNLAASSSLVVGMAEEVLRFQEKQKKAALVMKAQLEGNTVLPYPNALCNHANPANNNEEEATPNDNLHGSRDSGERKLSDSKLQHACNETVVKWAELVSGFLRQDWSKQVLDRLKPLPAEEFNFWKNRLRNLQLVQQQLMSPRARQVASILQAADSVYWSTLRNIYRDVQEGLQEAEDVTQNLLPVQEVLEGVYQMEYQQLKDKIVAAMEAVRLLWTRSKFYCKTSRIVVLLQEICNLLIHLSRKFLQGQEVLRGLVSAPGQVLKNIRVVIWTLQTLKEAYSQNRTLLENQSQQDTSIRTWGFHSHLVFIRLDSFLERLQNIKEVFCSSFQLYWLDQTVLGGVSGRMWTNMIQEVYQDFLGQVTYMTNLSCDPTDPEDQNFQLQLDQFQRQVLDLDTRLVSVLSKALEDCSSPSSAAKLLKMFGFVLDRPLIRDQLRPHLDRLVKVVLMDLDQIELLFYSQSKEAETFSRFSPTAAARLCWTRQLRLRAEDAMKGYQTIQHLCADSDKSQLVQQRFEKLVNLLLDCRDAVRSQWSSELDLDSEFILKHPLIQQTQRGELEVGCGRRVQAVLRELRYGSRERDVELRSHAAQLLAHRDDITQSYSSLSHMVSCYNQVVSNVLQVELPLIQDQLQDLSLIVSELQRNTWSFKGVQQQIELVLNFHSIVMEARANMDAITHITQVWAELHLLQQSGDSLLEGGVSKQTCSHIKEEGQELLRLTQVNRSLYRADASSESWIRYLDHVDDSVQDGLFQLLRRALRFLSDSTNPQSSGAVLMVVSLELQETGSVFEVSGGGSLSDFMSVLICDIYTAAGLPPRISVSRHGNYQVSLQQNPELSALEQEVMDHMSQVREEAELLRVELDRYSYLWRSSRKAVFQEFLTYGRLLRPEVPESTVTPPTLKDFQREIEALQRLSTEVSHLDEVIVLHGWLQVNLRPFRDSLLSIIDDWKHLYTQHLLDSVRDSLQQVAQCADDESSSSSRLPLTETILLLEAEAVQLPQDLAAQLQVLVDVP